MENKQAKILLGKYLEHQCTAQELRLVRELMQEPGTDEILHELMLERDLNAWTNPSGDRPFPPHLKELKRKVFAEIGAGSASFLTAGHRLKSHFWRNAALWTGLIVGLGAYTYLNVQQEPAPAQVVYIEKKNPFGQRSKIMLSDSSEIFLGAGSRVVFPKRFTGDTREIKLEGEAFFQVKKDSRRPFIVNTDKVQTRVLGTSFKVSAFKGELLSVGVATGRVNVSANQNGKLTSLAILTPGQMISWDRRSKSATLGLVDISHLSAWQHGDLVFDNVPLSDVSRELARWFSVKINISDSGVAAYQVNATFSADESIDQVMKVLAIGGKFNYTTADNKSFQVSKKN